MNPQSKYSDPILSKIKTNREKFEALLKTERLGYFGFDYVPPSEDGNDKRGGGKTKNDRIKMQRKNSEAEKKRLYHLLALAGHLRQCCFHGGDEHWLYQLSSRFKKDKEFLDTLDYYYNQRFNEINEQFINQNKINLAILEEIYPEEVFPEVAGLYYDFIVVNCTSIRSI